MMPASLRSVAATMGVRRFRRGRNLSAFLLTPPPRMNRLGPHELLDPLEVLVEVHRPGLPRQASLDPGGGGGPPLRRAAADLHLAELGVRDEHAVDERAGADAGPEGQEDDDATPSLAHAEAHLRDPRGVRVVDDGDRPVSASESCSATG